ncbi:MAG: flagellin [Rhizobiales bacterium]|nr:flagellin [Hyphomicrobiales bacterium]
MTSILTNSSAMVALQTLRQINQDLDTTNSRVSTGLKVGSAADSAAYWSIATTTKSDNGALSAVNDALGLGASMVNVVSTALQSVITSLTDIQNLLTTAQQPGVDRAKIQEQITADLNDILTKSTGATFNGQNWLSVDSSADGYNATKSILASFDRSGTTVSVSTIDLDITSVKLYDADSEDGIMDTERTAGGTDAAVKDIDISALTDSADDITIVSEYAQIVQAALAAVITANAKVGAIQNRITSQQTFVKALMDANTKAIGALTDADMEEESTKLKALQTQQSLAVQSLSIANSRSQNILTLFRQ